ncbi:hypothetical protein ACFWA5_49895 [Streptomyces mirabilis]|uniref:hypothetical protein n=1 Tax=Streptomyces mirabilis TaxID=68239 RepID=UPI003653FD8A
MPEDTTQLARLRTRMLATAYSNADFWTQRTAFLTDRAVAALARRDPAAAEVLAASLLAPEILHDTQILGAAVEVGIDTSAWEESREKTRTYTRDAYELPPQFDPATEAKRIWASLYDHYPQIAAALIDFLQGLPPPLGARTCSPVAPTPPPPPAGRSWSSPDRRPRHTTRWTGRTARPAPKPRTNAATTAASSPAWSTSAP